MSYTQTFDMAIFGSMIYAHWTEPLQFMLSQTFNMTIRGSNITATD